MKEAQAKAEVQQIPDEKVQLPGGLLIDAKNVDKYFEDLAKGREEDRWYNDGKSIVEAGAIRKFMEYPIHRNSYFTLRVGHAVAFGAGVRLAETVRDATGLGFLS